MSELFKKNYRAIVGFGKTDAQRKHWRANLIEVEFGWRYLEGNKEAYFTAEGTVWNHMKTYCIRGGQCLDYIYEKRGINALYRCIYECWKKYHLKYYHEIPEVDREAITALIGTAIKDKGAMEVTHG